jgi:hypothetical protein
MLYIYFLYRLLSQFSFNLSMDWEIPKQTVTTCKSFKDGVKDMLVKHHLFSWDL